jgi:hypothetical protein
MGTDLRDYWGPEGKIRHKVRIHYVDVKPICIVILYSPRALPAQICKVCRENGRRNDCGGSHIWRGLRPDLWWAASSLFGDIGDSGRGSR